MLASVLARFFVVALLALASFTNGAAGQATNPQKDGDGNTVDPGAGSDGKSPGGGGEHSLLSNPAAYALAAFGAVGAIVGRRSWCASTRSCIRGPTRSRRQATR